MPDPQPHPESDRLCRIAVWVIGLNLLITGAKFVVFVYTNSAAVLTDAIESIINVVAAGVMLYAVRLSNKPADREHPYGHGKVEFVAVGLEGGMILVAGGFIAYEAISRLIAGRGPKNLELGLWYVAGTALAVGLLAAFVWRAARRFGNAPMHADARHLFADFASTLAVLLGLTLTHFTGLAWLDPLTALAVVVFIGATSIRLLWESAGGLMDRVDLSDDAAIRAILDDEVLNGAICGYHKVRHRHQGTFHWVDMHLQVDPAMSITRAHDIASRIEGRVERCLGEANATAHIEPAGAPGT